MRFFDRKNETMPREELRQFQLERLQALLARLKRNVKRYRDVLGDLRVESLDDLKKLPVTGPQDLAANQPYGMFALPLREVIRLQSTIGPEGRQIALGHTRNDLAHWARLVARQLVSAGVTAHDVVQIRFGGGAFGKAHGYVLGAELIEASVIHQDWLHIEHQLAMLRDYRATVLITTPGNALDLMQEESFDPKTLSLRTVILTRPVPLEEKERLKSGLRADVYCNFGVAEILDPGLCVEAETGHLHVNEDHFIVEVENGELLVTTLCREAMPLLRYRTGIAGEIRPAADDGGRTGAILVPGPRLDGRLLVNEIPLYASQIEAVLAKTKAAGQPFRLEITGSKVIIHLQVTNNLFFDTMRTLIDLKLDIQSAFLSRLGLETDVRYVGGEK